MPSSIRLAMSISPSRVKSSTAPISRIYIRTGSVVRPISDSTLDNTNAVAASTASSSGTLSESNNSSESGASSRT